MNWMSWRKERTPRIQNGQRYQFQTVIFPEWDIITRCVYHSQTLIKCRCFGGALPIKIFLVKTEDVARLCYQVFFNSVTMALRHPPSPTGTCDGLYAAAMPILSATWRIAPWQINDRGWQTQPFLFSCPSIPTIFVFIIPNSKLWLTGANGTPGQPRHTQRLSRRIIWFALLLGIGSSSWQISKDISSRPAPTHE